MSDNIFAQAPFLPLKAPKAHILDYAGLLSTSQKAELEQAASGLAYKAKVVILPKDFQPSDPAQFPAQLAQQWNVQAGDRFLLVIDVKSHKVRVFSGEQLVARGIDTPYLQKTVIAQDFVPYARKGDVYGAIENTLQSVNQAVIQTPMPIGRASHVGRSQSSPGHYSTSTAAPARYPQYPSYSAAADGGWVFGFVGFLIAGCVAIFIGSFLSRRKANRLLAQEFNERVGKLYEQADQIGQASEYLSTETQPELAQRIATFFNGLTTLSQAQSEVEKLEKQKRVWQSHDGYIKCLRLIEHLEPEASSLQKDVNAITGGVGTVKNIPQVERPKVDDDRPIGVPAAVDAQFHRPTWSTQPTYMQPSVFGGGGLLGVMMLLTQVQSAHALGQIAHGMNGAQPFFGGGDGSQSQWMQQDQGPAADSGWTDWGGGGGGGDAGGDWGGGGDFGGFGGGDAGGDW